MSLDTLKMLIKPFQLAMMDVEETANRKAMRDVFAPDAALHMCHPFGDLTGPDALWNTCIGPLHAAMPDLERRDMIMLAGTNPKGRDWIGSMGGNYMGTFIEPFMDIPPTGHLTHMRYHEFYQIENRKISSMQAIWDMPELMMQSGSWPMATQLGKFLCTPSPLSGDGLNVSDDGQAKMDYVIGMLTALCKYPSDPYSAIMELKKFWHPRFNGYGSVGIGTMRGISGFRNWHQILILRGMPYFFFQR